MTSTFFGQHLWGEHLFAGERTPFVPSWPTWPHLQTDRGAFILDVCNSDGEILARLTDWYSGQMQWRLNEAGLIRLAYPADGEHADKLTQLNYLYLRMADGALIDKYRIGAITTTQSAEGERLIAVEGENLLGQLAYDDTGDINDGSSHPLAYYVNKILSYQSGNLGQPYISLLSLDYPDDMGSYTNIQCIERRSLLYALRSIQESIGGVFYVRPEDNKFVWVASTNTDGTVLDIRDTKNLLNSTVTTNYWTIRNKVIVNGQLTDGTAISSEAENSESQTSIAGARIWRTGTKVVQSQDDLDRIAELYAARMGKPNKTCSVGYVDLAQFDTLTDGQFIRPGIRVRLKDEAGNTVIKAACTSVTMDLANSAAVAIELGSLSGSGIFQCQDADTSKIIMTPLSNNGSPVPDAAYDDLYGAGFGDPETDTLKLGYENPNYNDYITQPDWTPNDGGGGGTSVEGLEIIGGVLYWNNGGYKYPLSHIGAVLSA